MIAALCYTALSRGSPASQSSLHAPISRIMITKSRCLGLYLRLTLLAHLQRRRDGAR